MAYSRPKKGTGTVGDTHPSHRAGCRRSQSPFSGLLVTFIAILSAGCSSQQETLTLATTSSTENSGLLAHIHPDFEQQTGIRIKVVARGTGASLQLGRDGNADVILVHARPQEDQFVEEGYGLMRRDVMFNDFVILGPKDDPAQVGKATTPVDALQRIAAAGHPFISRGDRSGTHMKEQELWRETDLSLQEKTKEVVSSGKTRQVESVRPDGQWYLSIGQSMGKTIVMATEKRAYTLADRGTYYAFARTEPAKTDLVVLCQGDPSLHNPYGVIAVNPKKHPDVNHKAAQLYIEWITSAKVQEMIGQYELQGKVLFHPNATM